jgi:hypothetical protein
MKYIITENRLNDIIFKFLDVKLDGIVKKKGEVVYIIFIFPNEEYGTLGWNKSGNLFINEELVIEISYFFEINNVDTLKVIGKWVEDRYNLKVMNTRMTEYPIF